MIKEAVALGLIVAPIALLFWAPADATALRFGLAPFLLGIGLQQGAFLEHDAMHNGVFSSAASRATAIAARSPRACPRHLDLHVAQKRNEHHAYTLRPHADPQFTCFPLWLRWRKEIPLWKNELPKVETKPRTRNAVEPAAVRHQAAARHLPAHRDGHRARQLHHRLVGVCAQGKHLVDMAAMAVHIGWYALLLRCAFETRMEMVIFTLVHYISVGILHVQLLLSHLSTTQLTAAEERAHGVFRAQLASTRNIASHWYSHWFHGGLEMQIEHHLFPQLPRHMLSTVAVEVRAIAKRHGISYKETTFFEALCYCLRDLRKLSTELATVDFI